MPVYINLYSNCSRCNCHRLNYYLIRAYCKIRVMKFTQKRLGISMKYYYPLWNGVIVSYQHCNQMFWIFLNCTFLNRFQLKIFEFLGMPFLWMRWMWTMSARIYSFTWFENRNFLSSLSVPQMINFSIWLQNSREKKTDLLIYFIVSN